MAKKRDDYESIDEIVLDSIPKSRGVTPTEAWEKYEAITKRIDIVPLFEQWNAAVKRLVKAQKLKLDKVKKTIRKAA